MKSGEIDMELYFMNRWTETYDKSYLINPNSFQPVFIALMFYE